MEISFLELQEHTVTRKVSNYFPCELLWSSIPLFTSYISFPFLSSLLFPPAFKIASLAPAVSRIGEDAPRTRVRAVNLTLIIPSSPFSSLLSLSPSLSVSSPLFYPYPSPSLVPPSLAYHDIYICTYTYIHTCVAVGLSTLPFPLLQK